MDEDSRSGRKNRFLHPSSHPHSLQRGVHLGFPEPDGPADFEIRDQSGHAPAVEVAFADLEVDARLFFGHQGGGGFGARAISWRVHAGVGRVNHCLTGGVVTNGDNQLATAVTVGQNGA